MQPRILGLLPAVLALVLSPVPARAFLGDCGQPVTFGTNPAASDALAVLRAAVGSFVCETCVCDVDDSGIVNASDSLRTLRFAVGSIDLLDCLACLQEEEIGPEGGVLQSRDRRVSISIPEGALAKETTLSIVGVRPSTLPAVVQGAERAYQLGPDDLEFDLPAEVDVILKGRATVSEGVTGAKLALLVLVEGGQTELLDVQQLFIDGQDDRTTAGATITHFSTLAVMRPDVTYSVDGLPETSQTSVPHTLDVRVEEDGAESLVDIVSAAYTDDDFGAWGPSEGDISNVTLPESPANVFEESFEYECSSAAAVVYRSSIATILDVTADIDGSPTNVPHLTAFEQVVGCQ